ILFAFVWMQTAKERGGLIFSAFSGLWLGVVWDLLFAGVTLGRLEEKDQAVSIVIAGLTLLTVSAWILNRFPLPGKIRKPLETLQDLFFCGVGGGMLLFSVLQFFMEFETGIFRRLQILI